VGEADGIPCLQPGIAVAADSSSPSQGHQSLAELMETAVDCAETVVPIAAQVFEAGADIVKRGLLVSRNQGANRASHRKNYGYGDLKERLPKG
jgi:hypothetical protein